MEVLKKYRELGAWNDLIRFADELPVQVRDGAQIQQMLALALNRRNQTDDRDRAIRLMEQLVARTGGDGETHGILGRIYKDRFEVTGDTADIQKAISHYRAGFEKEPSDYYPGVNLVTLLVSQGGEAGRREAAVVLPRVRAALAARMDPDRSDYWELATALELAAIAGDWTEARSFVNRIVSHPPERWMLETTIENLKRSLRATVPEREELRDVVQMLGEAVEREPRNA